MKVPGPALAVDTARRVRAFCRSALSIQQEAQTIARSEFQALGGRPDQTPQAAPVCGMGRLRRVRCGAARRDLERARLR